MEWFLLCLFILVMAALFMFCLGKISKKEEACEKQQPRKVIEKASEEYHDVIFYCCPSCGYEVNAKHKKSKQLAFAKSGYCSRCGQALTWGAENGTIL